jgi:hypothetical protein
MRSLRLRTWATAGLQSLWKATQTCSWSHYTQGNHISNKHTHLCAFHTWTQKFLTQRIAKYGEQRNDPNLDVASDMSPWLHYGQVRTCSSCLSACICDFDSGMSPWLHYGQVRTCSSCLSACICDFDSGMSCHRCCNTAWFLLSVLMFVTTFQAGHGGCSLMRTGMCKHVMCIYIFAYACGLRTCTFN